MSAATPGPALLEARGRTVRFGQVTALDGLDLVAPPDEVLAILGRNGAGKTTFVRTIATLLRPASGELRVRGVDVARDPPAVRRDIGLAGQLAAVEPTMTGRENLEMTTRTFGRSGPARFRPRAATRITPRPFTQWVTVTTKRSQAGGRKVRAGIIGPAGPGCLAR